MKILLQFNLLSRLISAEILHAVESVPVETARRVFIHVCSAGKMKATAALFHALRGFYALTFYVSRYNGDCVYSRCVVDEHQTSEIKPEEFEEVISVLNSEG